MRYEVVQGGDVFQVEVHEVGPHRYDVSVDDEPSVRVDAFQNPRSVYSVLLGARQYEGSVDELEDGTLDIHVGTSAFEFTATDARRMLLAGAGSAVATGVQTLRAQMPGRIVKLLVRPGESVQAGQGMVVIEAMKMENEIRSPIHGTVTEVAVREGDAVDTDELLIVVEPPEEG